MVRLPFQSEITESGMIRQEAALDSFKLLFGANYS
jgi:hypothetical protein